MYQLPTIRGILGHGAIFRTFDTVVIRATMSDIPTVNAVLVLEVDLIPVVVVSERHRFTPGTGPNGATPNPFIIPGLHGDVELDIPLLVLGRPTEVAITVDLDLGILAGVGEENIDSGSVGVVAGDIAGSPGCCRSGGSEEGSESRNNECQCQHLLQELHSGFLSHKNLLPYV